MKTTAVTTNRSVDVGSVSDSTFYNMGASVSIQNAEYDEEKFLKSKAILEADTMDDQQKFLQLKAIWQPATSTECTAGDATNTATKQVEITEAATSAETTSVAETVQ